MDIGQIRHRSRWSDGAQLAVEGRHGSDNILHGDGLPTSWSTSDQNGHTDTPLAAEVDSVDNDRSIGRVASRYLMPGSHERRLEKARLVQLATGLFWSRRWGAEGTYRGPGAKARQTRRQRMGSRFGEEFHPDLQLGADRPVMHRWPPRVLACKPLAIDVGRLEGVILKESLNC